MNLELCVRQLLVAPIVVIALQLEIKSSWSLVSLASLSVSSGLQVQVILTSNTASSLATSEAALAPADPKQTTSVDISAASSCGS